MKRCVVLGPILFWTGAACALTPNQWQYRQSIDVPATGLVQINLPLETSNILTVLSFLPTASQRASSLKDNEVTAPSALKCTNSALPASATTW